MHKKEMRIKKHLREEQLNQIKSNIRASIVLSYQQQNILKQANNKVITAVNNQDLNTLTLLLTEQNTNFIYNLHENAALACYSYFNKNLEDTRCINLLQILIQNNFITIFGKEELKSQNEVFLKSIYQMVDSKMKNISKGLSDYNGALNTGLNQGLKIIKQFYHTSLHKYCNSINKPQYIKYFILAWLPYLTQNKHYLFILTKIINKNQNSLEYREEFNIIQKYQFIYDDLKRSICECDDQRGLYSLIVIRHMFSICELEESFVLAVVNDYWYSVINKLLQDYNQKRNTVARNTLFQGFQSLDKLLFVISTQNSRLLGNSFLLEAPFYKLLFNLVLNAADKKYILYPIILKCIQILEFNRETLLDFITIKELDPLVLELTNHIDYRLLFFVLKIIYKLIRSSHMPCDAYQNLINYFFEQGLVYTLELLQFHKNRDISMLSIDLLQNEFRQQSFDYDYQICINKPSEIEYDHMG